MRNLAQRILGRMAFFGTDATIRGDGYEALIVREGVVVGRVYLGTVDEVEANR